MRCPCLLRLLMGTFLLGLASAAPAHAQLAGLADDLVLLTNRLRAKEAARTHVHLGPGPGESPFPAIPGMPGPLPSEPSESMVPGHARITAPPSRTPSPPPLYGSLEVPATPDEGPPNGITLDQAIERLVQVSPGLRTRFQELTKAQADILSAGLRNNPFVFGNVGTIPYGNYSAQRPGGANYEVTVIQPWDINQKRVSRIRVAQSAKTVLEALYQDSVRLEIDNLYTAFLDVLAAREALRQQEIGLAGLEAVAKATRSLVESGQAAPTDLDRVLVQRDSAFMAVEEARTAFRQAKQSLAVVLNVPPAEVDALELRGTVAGPNLSLPGPQELSRVALEARPDLNAFRLGVHRAQAEVQLARAERWSDVFVLYTPWQLQDNSALGAQNATSWSLGALVTLPVFNRNQGNIARAQATAGQTLIELQGRERQVVAEVERAYLEYTTTRHAVQRFQNDILPRARRIRDEYSNWFKRGGAGVLMYLNAQKDYNEVVRHYLETALRHRRSQLRLNTAVGQRVVP